MQETEAFVFYEKSAKYTHIFSVISAIFFLANAAISISGIIIAVKHDLLNLFIYIILAVETVVLGCLAITFCIWARKQRSVIGLYRAYSRILNHCPHNAVDVISESMGVSKGDVMKNFIMLDALGFFSSLIIDTQNGLVSIGEETNDKEEGTICPICGGKMIKEQEDIEKCDFCGTIVEKNKLNE